MTAARVLVVEDDSLQQEFLRAVLERRGYVAETASDGLSAVNMLRSGRYDLALIDYQLPEIDGLASARLIHDMMGDGERPKLIAVTANEASLRDRGTSTDVFDAILRKPLDMVPLLETLGRYLDGGTFERARRAHGAKWQEAGLAHQPRAIAFPNLTSDARETALRSCFDLSGARPAELILLTDPDAVDELLPARLRSDLFGLPVVDLTGQFRDVADASFSTLDPNSWRSVAETVQKFSERRAQLSPMIAAASSDLALRVLAYLFLSGRPLFPRHEERSQSGVTYPGFFPHDVLLACVERLADRGLAERLRVGQAATSRGPSGTVCAYTLTGAGLLALTTAAPQLPPAMAEAPETRATVVPTIIPSVLPSVLPSLARSAPAAEPLPPALLDWLDLFQPAGRGQGALPITVAMVSYDGRERMVAHGSETGFRTARQRFLDALAQALGADGVTQAGEASDFVLAQNKDSEALAEFIHAFGTSHPQLGARVSPIDLSDRGNPTR